MSAVPISEAVSISFASRCDRGKVREENQDSVLRSRVPLGDLLIVADGIGGYAGGGVASRMAVEVFSSALSSVPAFFPPAIAIQEAACRANAEIAAAAVQPSAPYSRMGTTVVLALIQQDSERASAPVQVWIGHIGDSRAYLLHRGKLRRLTQDHSAMKALSDRNLITPEGARRHPNASVLTRGLGLEVNVEIELAEVALEPGDSLLLCSDGLWSYVAENEIERILADEAHSVQDASQALLNLALDAGGHDNVAIEIARVAQSSDSVAAAASAVTSEPGPSSSNRLPDLSGIDGSKPETVAARATEIPSHSDQEMPPVLEPAQIEISDAKSASSSEIDFVPKFESASQSGISVATRLSILILCFAASCVLLYSAIVQNWFGVDGFLR
jgi:PPM family protein phosphatase